MDDIEIAFDKWWREEGSGVNPTKSEDVEECMRRLCRIAWMNGAYTEIEHITERHKDE